jgi:2Fe-2S ferredoxin
MATVIYTLLNGDVRRIDVEDGLSVMTGAVQNDLPGIDADCGGSCECATCHVYVDDAWLARLEPPGEAEREMLTVVAAPPRAGSRLACQLVVGPELDGIEVTLPERQAF